MHTRRCTADFMKKFCARNEYIAIDKQQMRENMTTTRQQKWNRDTEIEQMAA